MFVILLAETHDALDQLGAWRHLVGPKHHSFQPKVVTHSFCPENVENNYNQIDILGLLSNQSLIEIILIADTLVLLPNY